MRGAPSTRKHIRPGRESTTVIRPALRVLADQEKYDEALALLEIGDRGAFSGSYDELRGDILVLQGDRDGARAAYQQAESKLRAVGADVSLLNIKLDDIGRSES